MQLRPHYARRTPGLIAAVMLFTALLTFTYPQSALAQSGTTFPAGLNLFSVPYTYSGTLDSVFGYTGVKLKWYNPASFSYVQTPTPPADKLDLGTAYWATFPNAISLAAGTPANQSQDFTYSLQMGWNIVGNPFNIPIPLSSTLYNGIPYAQASILNASGLVNPIVYAYSTSTAAYVPVTILVPGGGYQVYSVSNVTMLFPAPANTATHFSVSGVGTILKGTPATLTVQALDSNNAPVISYNGSVKLSSTDTAASLPAATALSNGSASIAVTMATPGSQTVSATDVSNSSLTGSSSIYVNSNAFSSVPLCR